MRRIVIVLGLAFAIYPMAAWATNTASFQGNCTSGTLTCTFDASRPSPGSQCTNGIAEYKWDLGGTLGSYFTTSSTFTYTFPSSGYYTVTLTVYCWDGATPTTSHDVCYGASYPGCIYAGGGWLP
jgi:PKD domain